MRIVWLLTGSLALLMTGYGVVFPVFARRLAELGSGVEALGLMSMAFAIGQFVAAPFMGALADRIGRRPLILVALASVIAANIAYLLADSVGMFMATRFAVGALSAGLLPAAMAVVGDIVPSDQRARWSGTLMGGYGVGFIFGPTLGGAGRTRPGARLRLAARDPAERVRAARPRQDSRPKPDRATSLAAPAQDPADAAGARLPVGVPVRVHRATARLLPVRRPALLDRVVRTDRRRLRAGHGRWPGDAGQGGRPSRSTVADRAWAAAGDLVLRWAGAADAARSAAGGHARSRPGRCPGWPIAQRRVPGHHVGGAPLEDHGAQRFGRCPRRRGWSTAGGRSQPVAASAGDLRGLGHAGRARSGDRARGAARSLRQERRSRHTSGRCLGARAGTRRSWRCRLKAHSFLPTSSTASWRSRGWQMKPASTI